MELSVGGSSLLPTRENGDYHGNYPALKGDRSRSWLFALLNVW